MEAAQLFVRCLENEKVQYIFAVPGEDNVRLMIAFQDSAIIFILHATNRALRPL